MMFKPKPKPTVESLKAIIGRLEAQGKNASSWRVRLRETVNAQLIKELKAARLRGKRSEAAA